MSYCFERGIPHSEFLDWDPEDRAKALAFALEQAQRCQMCGTAPWEWEENRFAYTPIEELCTGCYQKSVFSETSNKPLPGTTVVLKPTTPLLRAQMTRFAQKREKMSFDE